MRSPDAPYVYESDPNNEEDAELNLLAMQRDYAGHHPRKGQSALESSQQSGSSGCQRFIVCLLLLLISLTAASIVLQLHLHPSQSFDLFSSSSPAPAFAPANLVQPSTSTQASELTSPPTLVCPDCPSCAPPTVCPECASCPSCKACPALQCPPSPPTPKCEEHSLVPDPKSNLMPLSNFTHASVVLICPLLHDRDFIRARHFAAEDTPEERALKEKEGDIAADNAGIVSGLGSFKVSHSRQSESIYVNASLQSRPYPNVAPTYSQTASDSFRLDLSGWKDIDTMGLANLNLWWPIYEVDVDSEAGELIVPLVLEMPAAPPKNSKIPGLIFALLEKTPLLPAFQLLVHHRRIECDITYPDQTTSTRLASLVNPGEIRDTKKRPPTLHLLCPFHAMWRPTSVKIRITTPEEPLWMLDSSGKNNITMGFGEWSGEITIALCHSFERRVEVAMVVQPVFNGRLNEFMDWADYHRRIGVDTIYVPEREGKMYFQDDLDANSVHAGRLRLAIEQDYIRYSLMPVRTGNVVDQEFVNQINVIRSKRSTKWLLTLDMDEYLVWYDEPKPYNRACDNSLWCPSPLVEWLEGHQMSSAGLLFILNDMAVGSKNSPILPELILPEDVWRHSKWLDPKMDASRICPFEPQTDAMKKRVAAFQQEQKKKALAAPGADIAHPDDLLCELPYSVQHVYTHDVNSIYARPAARGLYRPSLTLQALCNQWPTTRDTVWANWGQIRSRHFGDMRGRVHLKMDRNGKVWPRPNDTAYWHGEHPPIYDRNVADVMQYISLPPPATEEHIFGNMLTKKRDP